MYDKAEGFAEASNKAQFKWAGGSVAFSEFGEPTTTTDYALCVYDATRLLTSIDTPAANLCDSSPCWSVKDVKIKYKSERYPENGIKVILGKSNTSDKASLQLKTSSSTAVPAIALSGLTYPVTAQIVTSNAGCWEAQFTAADEKKNDGVTFKASHKQ